MWDHIAQSLTASNFVSSVQFLVVLQHSAQTKKKLLNLVSLLDPFLFIDVMEKAKHLVGIGLVCSFQDADLYCQDAAKSGP